MVHMAQRHGGGFHQCPPLEQDDNQQLYFSCCHLCKQICILDALLDVSQTVWCRFYASFG